MTTGMYYTFITYLEEIEKQLQEYKDQPVIFMVENKVPMAIDTVNRDYGDKSVWFGIKDIENNQLIGLTLSELIMKAKTLQEECFDFIPVLAKFEKNQDTVIRKDIPLTEVSVGLTEDKEIYVFVIKDVLKENLSIME